MTIFKESQQTQDVIRITGDFDAAQAQNARRYFQELIEDVDKNICLDLSQVPFIDSSGIGAIVFLYKRLRCSGYDLTISGLQKQPSELLHLLRIDKIIKMLAE